MNKLIEYLLHLYFHLYFYLYFHWCRKRSYLSVKMKRKKITSSLKSSPDENEKTYLYLLDDYWERIFRFIINYSDVNKNHCNLNCLSLVYKQFRSIANGLLFSLGVQVEKCHFLPRLFNRFTKLNTLDLRHFNDDRNLDMLLHQISNFPLKLTSLKLPKTCTFPLKGLQNFSQNITTLASLTCFILFLGNNEISLIADYFPFTTTEMTFHIGWNWLFTSGGNRCH